MISEIIKQDKRLSHQYEELLNVLDETDKALLQRVDHYLHEYSNFHHFTLKQVIDVQNRFVERYLKDLIEFEEEQQYPCALGTAKQFKISRKEYDLSLMLSVLLTKHRFTIMKRLSTISEPLGNTLVVGVGSGMEISLLQNKYERLDAYDLRIDDFPKTKLEEVSFYEKEYVFTGEHYNTVIAIELLEHLENPFELLKAFCQSLKNKGQLILTTATNLPQFDHLTNFSEDAFFEEKLQEAGFGLKLKEEIPHHYPLDIQAKNTFYIFEKNE
ncbi:methyltransferase domain-containing protein [Deltaproteobacteria bacterium TL4]